MNQLAVEALDIAILYWPLWRNEDMPDALLDCLGYERSTGKLRPFVGKYSGWIATEQRSLNFTPEASSAFSAVTGAIADVKNYPQNKID